MIQLSDVFSCIGGNGCVDVASSLKAQGVDLDSGMSIPIYEIFYLKILSEDRVGFLCSSIQEFTALKQLTKGCGAVTCAINLLDNDLLSLTGLLCTYTPRTGMVVFYKNNIPDLQKASSDIISQIVKLAGIPIDLNYQVISPDIANQALSVLMNKLAGSVNENLSSYGIQIMDWNRIPYYINQIKANGEMNDMYMMRRNAGALYSNENIINGNGMQNNNIASQRVIQNNTVENTDIQNNTIGYSNEGGIMGKIRGLFK